MELKTKIVLFAATNLLASLSLASPQITLQAGSFYTTQGRNQHVDITGLIGDDFSVNHRHDSDALLGVGLYFKGKETSWSDFLYGVDAFYFARTQVTGNVTQESLFTNLSYQYSITNFPLYLAGKAILKNTWTDKVNVTFDLGMGPNVISTSDFSESSLDDGVTQPDRIFGGKNTVALSGMVGVGLKWNHAFGNNPAECGYRFFYLGQGRLNPLTNQTTTLKTGTLHANALICSVSF